MILLFNLTPEHRTKKHSKEAEQQLKRAKQIEYETNKALKFRKNPCICQGKKLVQPIT